MTSFRKKISYTFVFTRLSHEIVQYDQIPLRYVHDYSVVDIVGKAFIELDSGHRPQHIKIRWLPLTITPDDTLRRWAYSFLYILQENFNPYSLASLGTSCNDACTWVLQYSCTSRLCRCKLNGLEKYFPQICHE
jgi:hypothetical protein